MQVQMPNLTFFPDRRVAYEELRQPRCRLDVEDRSDGVVRSGLNGGRYVEFEKTSGGWWAFKEKGWFLEGA